MADNKITMNSFPSVTLIIPVYNGMSTLPECLDSLEKQDYPGEVEYIIVDDGSSDGSGEYCISRGFRVMRQQNQGPGVARNIGAKVASGEYLVFTDADCVLNPDFITELVRPLMGTDIIGSQGVFYSNQSNIVARFIQHEVSERMERERKVDYIDWVATYAACYRKDVFLENGGFIDTYSSEDVELSFRLSEKGCRMVMAPKAQCRHRNYENFLKFLRFKYKRAYWTVWLYKKYPRRIAKDRLTPATRKSMMVFMAAAILFMLLSIWWKASFYIAVGWWIVFCISTLPFTFKVISRKDYTVGMLSPLFLLIRTTIYIAGFTKGLYDYWRGMRTVKRSAVK